MFPRRNRSTAKNARRSTKDVYRNPMPGEAAPDQLLAHRANTRHDRARPRSVRMTGLGLTCRAIVDAIVSALDRRRWLRWSPFRLSPAVPGGLLVHLNRIRASRRCSERRGSIPGRPRFTSAPHPDIDLWKSAVDRTNGMRDQIRRAGDRPHTPAKVSYMGKGPSTRRNIEPHGAMSQYSSVVDAWAVGGDRQPRSDRHTRPHPRLQAERGEQPAAST